MALLQDCISFSCVSSLFHARGAVTEKAQSLIRRRTVHGKTRLPDNEACSADRAGMSKTINYYYTTTMPV